MKISPDKSPRTPEHTLPTRVPRLRDKKKSMARSSSAKVISPSYEKEKTAVRSKGLEESKSGTDQSMESGPSKSAKKQKSGWKRLF